MARELCLLLLLQLAVGGLSSISEVFYDSFDYSISTAWTIVGGSRSNGCGAQGASALMFHTSSTSRYAIGPWVTLPSGGDISFYFRLGSGGNCELVDSGEYVVLERQIGSSSSTWTQVWTSNAPQYFSPSTITQSLAASSQQQRLRWRQLKNSGSGFDEWMLDSVSIKGVNVTGTVPANNVAFSLNFDSSSILPSGWSSSGGGRGTACGMVGAAAWTFSSSASSRWLESEWVSAPQGGDLTFTYRLGYGGVCEKVDSGEGIVLEYSTPTTGWTKLWDRTTGSSSNQQATVMVPATSATSMKFRWRQLKNSGSGYDEWMVDAIEFIVTGSSTGSGSGTPTQPPSNTYAPSPNPSTTIISYAPSPAGPVAPPSVTGFTDNFDISISSLWTGNKGGVRATTCGYQGSRALWFGSTSGVREIISPWINVTGGYGGTLKFYYRLGNGGICEAPDTTSERLYLYSQTWDPATDSTSGWSTVWNTGSTSSYLQLRTVTASANSKLLRYKWKQGSNSGVGYDEWAIDTVSFTPKGPPPPPPPPPAPPSSYVMSFSDNFDQSISPLWTGNKGGLRSTMCGYQGYRALWFGSTSGVREIISPWINITAGGLLKFYYRIGNGVGSCERVDSGEGIALQIQRDNSQASWGTLWTTGYPGSSLYSSTRSIAAANQLVRFRWRQSSNSGSGMDEWALDTVSFTPGGSLPPPPPPPPPAPTPPPVVGQFSDNFDTTISPLWSSRVGGYRSTTCGRVGYSGSALMFGSSSGTRMVISPWVHANNGGILAFYYRLGNGGLCERVDSGEGIVLEQQKDDGTAGGSSYQPWVQVWAATGTSSYFRSITLNIQPSTMAVRFRWRQLKNSGSGMDEWAMDSVSYTNQTGVTVAPPANVPGFSDNFENSISPLWTGNKGGKLGTVCGRQGVNALWFGSTSGVREITSPWLNTTFGGTLSFFYRLGNGGSCEAIDSGEGITLALQYAGHSTWSTVWSSSSRSSTLMPKLYQVAASPTSVRFRWRQSKNTGANYDEWAIDSVSFTGSAVPNSGGGGNPSLPFITGNGFDSPGSANSLWVATGGSLSTQCGYQGSNAQFFGGSGSRSLTSPWVGLPQGGSLSFFIRIGSGSFSGCERVDYGEDVVVELQTTRGGIWRQWWTSKNKGLTTANTVTLALPANPTRQRFRWRQLRHTGWRYDEWAVDSIALRGFNGVVLQPPPPANPVSPPTTGAVSSFADNFESASMSVTVTGGSRSNQCGSESGTALSFSGSGTRQLTSPWVNAPTGGTLKFYFKLGSGGTCENVDSGEYVVLERQLQSSTGSNYGGSYSRMWSSSDLSVWKSAHWATISVPASPTAQRFRWRQLKFSGSNMDEWMIDSISFSDARPKPVLSFIETFDTSHMDATILGGSRNTHCGSQAGMALSFSSRGAREVMAPWVSAPNGGSLRFWFRLGNDMGGCESVDAGEYVVLEQQSLGAGANAVPGPWVNLWSSNDLSLWKTARWATVAIPPASANFTLQRFRWRQLRHSGAGFDEWMIDSVTYSEALAPVVPVRNNVTSFLDNFEPTIAPFWTAVRGGSISNGALATRCGYQGASALTFSGSGYREIVSPWVDAENGGDLSFYFALGAGVGPGSCEKVDPGEYVVLEQQLSGGKAEWNVIWDTASIGKYTNPATIALVVPAPPVGFLFRLRWRQVKHTGSANDQWMLDTVSFNPLPPANVSLTLNGLTVASLNKNSGAGMTALTNTLAASLNLAASEITITGFYQCPNPTDARCSVAPTRRRRLLQTGPTGTTTGGSGSGTWVVVTFDVNAPTPVVKNAATQLAQPQFMGQLSNALSTTISNANGGPPITITASAATATHGASAVVPVGGGGGNGGTGGSGNNNILTTVTNAAAGGGAVGAAVAAAFVVALAAVGGYFVHKRRSRDGHANLDGGARSSRGSVESHQAGLEMRQSQFSHQNPMAAAAAGGATPGFGGYPAGPPVVVAVPQAKAAAAPPQVPVAVQI